MSDLISRQAAIDALDVGAEVLRRVLDEADVVGVERAKYEWGLGLIESYIADVNDLPSAQSEPHYDEWCADCKEYDTDKHCCPRWNRVIRQTLKDAQPEQQWIPCSEPPKESGTYIVTAYDGADKRVTFVKYQKTLKRWDLTGARSYWHILAYKPLPEPWRGESNDRT